MNTIIGKTASNQLKELLTDLNGLIYITGISGSGKSHLVLLNIIQALMKGFPVIIFDFGNTYNTTHIPKKIFDSIKSFIQIHNIARNGLPINTFKPKIIKDENGVYEESTKQVVSRIAAMIQRSLHIGNQQKAALYIAIRDCIDYVHNNKIPDYFLLPDNSPLVMEISEVNWKSIVFILKMLANAKKDYACSANTLYSILMPIIDNFAVNPDLSWDKIISKTEHKITIISMKGLSIADLKLVVNILLEDLFHYIVGIDNEVPFMAILDEFQICGFKFDESSPLHTLLTQGRKYNFNAILATQHPIKALESELNQAATRIIMKPDLSNINYLNRQLPKIKSANWRNILTSMPRGYCIVYNGIPVKDYKDMLVKIFSYEELLTIINENNEVKDDAVLNNADLKLK